jgi:hypothetical protein
MGPMVKSLSRRLAVVGMFAMTWFSVAACDRGDDVTITTSDEEWSRCLDALDFEWPDYTLGLVYTARPMELSDFLGITEPATVCTATGPQGQSLWLALTLDGRRLVFVAGSDGLPTPAP